MTSHFPRPLREALHGSAPNQALHYNCLYIYKEGRSIIIQPFEYVLIVKDDFSGLVRLIPAAGAYHLVVADALR